MKYAYCHICKRTEETTARTAVSVVPASGGSCHRGTNTGTVNNAGAAVTFSYVVVLLDVGIEAASLLIQIPTLDVADEAARLHLVHLLLRLPSQVAEGVNDDTKHHYKDAKHTHEEITAQCKHELRANTASKIVDPHAVVTSIQQDNDNEGEERHVEKEACEVQGLLLLNRHFRDGVANATAVPQARVRREEEALVQGVTSKRLIAANGIVLP